MNGKSLTWVRRAKGAAPAVLVAFARAASVAPGEGPAGPSAKAAVCIADERVPPDTGKFIRSAVAVLRESGREPGDYTVEVGQDDPFTLRPPGSPAEPVISAVFTPRDGPPLYAVKVNAVHPCAVGWVWDPPRFTKWQREVVERAGEAARELRAGGATAGPLEVQVVETRDVVGVRVRPAEAASDLRILMRKSDLSIVDRED